MLNRFKIENLFQDMVHHPNLRMIGTPQEEELCHQYLLERFNIEARAENIFSCPFFGVVCLKGRP
jgi:hypothetical protein